MNDSQKVNSKIEKHSSRLISAISNLKNTSDYSLIPEGVWQSVAIIRSGDVTINSEDIDLEFNVPFDDNLESNESEIIIYNLSNNTINNLKDKAKITIEAGYKGDTGIIYEGYITKKKTTHENADRITTLKCCDDIAEKEDIAKTYVQGTAASTILYDLLGETRLPIATFKPRRNWTYENAIAIDEKLETAIKKYSEVCGVSTFVNKGNIYCQHIKDFTDVNFTVSEETGMIGSPAPYSEELTAEDFTDTIDGYEITMLLQHRISPAAGIKLKSKEANGTFRVRSGEHIFNESECITKIKVF